jgi:hypothetical protein
MKHNREYYEHNTYAIKHLSSNESFALWNTVIRLLEEEDSCSAAFYSLLSTVLCGPYLIFSCISIVACSIPECPLFDLFFRPDKQDGTSGWRLLSAQILVHSRLSPTLFYWENLCQYCFIFKDPSTFCIVSVLNVMWHSTHTNCSILIKYKWYSCVMPSVSLVIGSQFLMQSSRVCVA